MEEKRFEELKRRFVDLTDEQKAEIRGLLGIVLNTKVSNPGSRVTGKVQGTGKAVEVKIAKQMEILIKSLPVDTAIDLNEWAKRAVENGLQTQQPAVRIAAYYKKSVVDGGFATLVA